jgi:beta-glucosidase
MMMNTDVWLLAALYFGGAVDAAISSNYTQAILSSGTGK